MTLTRSVGWSSGSQKEPGLGEHGARGQCGAWDMLSDCTTLRLSPNVNTHSEWWRWVHAGDECPSDLGAEEDKGA